MVTASQLNQTSIFSDTEFISTEHFVQEIRYLPELEDVLKQKIYIRGSLDNITDAAVKRKVESLTYRNSDGNVSLIRVNDPVTLYTYQDVTYALNGNSRKKALTTIFNSPEYAGVTFADIPVRYVLGQLSAEDLKRLQIDANDTTDSHRTLDLALNLIEDYNAFANAAMSAEGIDYNGEHLSGLKESAAKAYATKYVCQTYNISEAYCGQLRAIALLPQWLLGEVDKGTLTPEMARQINIIATQAKVSVRGVFDQCFALAKPDKETGMVKITQSVVKEIKKQYSKVDSKADTDTDTDASANTGEGEKAPKEKKIPEGFKADAAKETISKVLMLACGLNVPKSKAASLIETQSSLLGNTVKAMLGVASKIATTNLVKPDRTLAVIEASQFLLTALFDDPEILNGIDQAELHGIYQSFNSLAKHLGVLAEVIDPTSSDDTSTSEDLEDSEDEDLEDSEDDSEEAPY